MKNINSVTAKPNTLYQGLVHFYITPLGSLRVIWQPLLTHFSAKLSQLAQCALQHSYQRQCRQNQAVSRSGDITPEKLSCSSELSMEDLPSLFSLKPR